MMILCNYSPKVIPSYECEYTFGTPLLTDHLRNRQEGYGKQ
jgi:hypothetical protein